MLVGQLQAVVGEIHAAGVVHGDLESQNIKVTPNKTVYILDFEKASLASPSSQYTDELRHEQARLDYLSTVVSEKVSRTPILCIVPLVIRMACCDVKEAYQYCKETTWRCCTVCSTSWSPC